MPDYFSTIKKPAELRASIYMVCAYCSGSSTLPTVVMEEEVECFCDTG
jgi:hypothetical protein